MIRTCSAPTQSKGGDRLGFMSRLSRGGNCFAFTLTEMMVVMVIFSLFIMMATVNVSRLFRKERFKTQAQEFISIMQMAATAAAQSDKRYEVVIDLTEQNYFLREISTSELSEVLEDEIIADKDFSENCRVSYVLFDDKAYTNEGRARFRAGRAGWQYGGRIVLIDEEERMYSVVVNRINRTVILREGEVELLEPKSKDEVPF
ncbi:MAG: prepilin-type N-terminal cleavage/methylation domain-containing protein [Planctomycetes bacterium]|nr:prepilin-type N-terminal cleavage/methylation domain-containing protein [Planctomycetota bacterium]